MSAALGGTQSLHTNSFDEAVGLPTDLSARIARNTQLIVQEESQICHVVDPLAGSYLVEHLTDEIESRAGEYIGKIDDLGGALMAIEKGYIQGEIQEAAYRYQKAIECGEEIVVGVNAFQGNEEIELEQLKVDPEIEAGQRARLETLRGHREKERVAQLLAHLETAARGSGNLMPVFIECVENDITLGEICGVLREVWGEYHPPAWL